MLRRMKQLLAAMGLLLLVPLPAAAADAVATKAGPIQGTTEADGLRVFKGIPFAAPPIGPLRWQPPQPVARWKDVRQATAFGAQCMQRRIYGDMIFRAAGNSEDCLFLNVWTPAKTGRERLPVLVYFYGGGFNAGDGSEPRYEGAAMARRGIVALTVNYRLGLFGFLAHPELTKESPRHASGNYGLLDQAAALAWVHDNIAAFGGDPAKVTIAGESAGSISVSALMASPLSRTLIAGAIGESGAAIAPTFNPVPLAEAEKTGTAFAALAGADSLAALRGLTAEALLEAAAKPAAPRLPIAVDGYFLPKTVAEIFAAGEQAHVPLLAGWHSQESPAAHGALPASGGARWSARPGRTAVTGLSGTGAEAVTGRVVVLRRRHRVVPAQRLFGGPGRQSGEQDAAVVADEHRARGDVPVHPAVRVQDPQRGQDVGGDLRGAVGGERFLREQGGQRSRGHQLADDPQRPALGEHVEDLVEPGVVGNPRGRLRRVDRAQHRRFGGPPGAAGRRPPHPAVPGHEPVGQPVRVEHLGLDHLGQRHLAHQDFLPAVGVEGPALGEFVLVGRRQGQAVAVG